MTMPRTFFESQQRTHQPHEIHQLNPEQADQAQPHIPIKVETDHAQQPTTPFHSPPTNPTPPPSQPAQPPLQQPPQPPPSPPLSTDPHSEPGLSGGFDPEQVYATKFERGSAVPRERKVPASSFGRVLGFGGVAMHIAFGTISDMAHKLAPGEAATGSSNGNLILSDANAERLVSGLCRMRGAALKVTDTQCINTYTQTHRMEYLLFRWGRCSASRTNQHYRRSCKLSWSACDRFITFFRSPFL